MALPGRLPELRPAALRCRLAVRQPGEVGHSGEPEPEGADVAALLDSAEDIVNAAAPEILAEFDKKRNEGRVPAQGPGQGQREGQAEALR